MGAKPVYAATVTLAFIMAGPSHASPPSDLSSLFPGDGWEKCRAAVSKLYDPAALRGYRIYVFPKTVAPAFVAEEMYGGPLPGPAAESWLFFVDEVPAANWGHPCRVIFITTGTCKLTAYECLFPPTNFDEFRDVTKEALILWDE
jgi:hypothetical protein